MLRFNPIATNVQFDNGVTKVQLHQLSEDGKRNLFTAFFECDSEDAPRAGDTVEIEIIV